MSRELAKQKTVSTICMKKEEVEEIFGDSHIDAQGLTFNVIKIVRETAQFEVAEGEYVPTLRGHILYKHFANQWWEVPFDERDEDDDPMPQCYSIDGIKPSGGSKIQSDFCATCPLNKFGSAGEGKKSKACRNTLRMLFLQDGSILPVVLSAPPTSLGKKSSIQRWMNEVPNRVGRAYGEIGIRNAQGGPVVDYWPVHVELFLEKEKFDSGTASVIKIRTLDILLPDTEENAAKLKQLYQIVKAAKDSYKKEIESYLTEEIDNVDNVEDIEDVEDVEDVPF